MYQLMLQHTHCCEKNKNCHKITSRQIHTRLLRVRFAACPACEPWLPSYPTEIEAQAPSPSEQDT